MISSLDPTNELPSQDLYPISGKKVPQRPLAYGEPYATSNTKNKVDTEGNAAATSDLLAAVTRRCDI
jgi:hypothetical protein|uniref:Uncharacterized protein n=1 Tax=Oryza sativa subsp. japonica TaxID=39947 RepID=Q6ZL52_ORYSJ|nr:hypothetical protein [Oryza sativa Japonica Group]